MPPNVAHAGHGLLLPSGCNRSRRGQKPKAAKCLSWAIKMRPFFGLSEVADLLPLLHPSDSFSSFLNFWTSKELSFQSGWSPIWTGNCKNGR